jgi:hypothetical protein
MQILKRLTNRTALVVGFVMLGSTVLAAPAAVLKNASFDFGFVPQQAKISHVFQIMSTGDDTLKIVQVIPGCGCTKAPLEKSEIAPGESTCLEVIFSTGQYKGRVTKHPRIVTNEEQSERTLEFLSTVMSRPDSTYPLIIQPAILDFTNSGNESLESISMIIRNVSDNAVALKLIDFPEGIFEVKLPESIPAGGRSEATIRLADAKNAPGFEKSFTIELDDASSTRFTVPVKLSTSTEVRHAKAQGLIER